MQNFWPQRYSTARKRLAVLLFIGLSPISLPAHSSEVAVRSAFVFNFIKFIEWPQVSPHSKFNLCVIEPSSEYKSALSLLQDREAKQTQPIDVIYLSDKISSQNKIENCQMVYKTLKTSNFNLPHPLPTGIVLVADEPKETELDVSIGLVHAEDDRLRFFVNQAALNRSGVKVSSQLLKLSKGNSGGKE